MIANTGIIVGICCYFCGMILVGYLMRNKNKGAEDFLVGGRSFGMFFNTGTLTACWLGGAIIVACPGLLVGYGIWSDEAQYGFLLEIGAGFCLLLAGLFYMRRLWRLKLLSLGDFYYIRYGRNAGILATVLMGFTFVIWIAVQVIAFAKIGTSQVGWQLEYWIIISMFVICTYTILGGLWAVCLTDIIQVSIVTLSLFILAPVAVSMVGGWDTFVAAIPPEKLQLFPADKTSIHSWLPWIATMMIIGLGSIASPDLMQRAFSAKSPKTARNSAFGACIIYFIVLIVVAILTFAAMQLMHTVNIDPTIIEQDPELLIPLVFQKTMPVPLVIVFLGAVLAAVMSAAATANIALAGVVSKNLIHDIFVPTMSSRGLMQTSRAVILVLGVLSTLIAIGLPSAYLLLALGFDLIMSCLFIPLTLGLYWSKGNGFGAIAGLLAGATYRIVGSGLLNGFSLEGIGTPLEGWYYFTIGGPIVSLIFMVVVSLLTQKTNPPIPLIMEPDPDA